MTNARRQITCKAVGALDAEIAVRRIELAALERARDNLDHALATPHPGRCDAYRHDSPCDGLVAARYCRHCGWTVTRCEGHGGIRAATYQLEAVHVADGSCPGCPAADDQAGVR